MGATLACAPMPQFVGVRGGHRRVSEGAAFRLAKAPAQVRAEQLAAINLDDPRGVLAGYQIKAFGRIAAAEQHRQR